MPFALVGLCAWTVYRSGPVGPLIGLYLVPILFVLSLIAGIAFGLRKPDEPPRQPPSQRGGERR